MALCIVWNPGSVVEKEVGHTYRLLPCVTTAVSSPGQAPGVCQFCFAL